MRADQGSVYILCKEHLRTRRRTKRSMTHRSFPEGWLMERLAGRRWRSAPSSARSGDQCALK